MASVVHDEGRGTRGINIQICSECASGGQSEGLVRCLSQRAAHQRTSHREADVVVDRADETVVCDGCAWADVEGKTFEWPVGDAATASAWEIGHVAERSCPACDVSAVSTKAVRRVENGGIDNTGCA